MWSFEGSWCISAQMLLCRVLSKQLLTYEAHHLAIKGLQCVRVRDSHCLLTVLLAGWSPGRSLTGALLGRESINGAGRCALLV